MRRALEGDKSILKNAKKETVSTLRTRVRELIDASGAGEDVEAIGELIGA